MMEGAQMHDLMGTDETLEQARELVRRLEAGDSVAARLVLEDLARVRETELFQEIGKLTRELHDTLSSFRLDSRLTDIAAQEIPDAKERLNHVIEMTEDAANRTLGAVEESLPVSEGLKERALAINGEWQRFRAREMTVDEFRRLSRHLDAFLPQVEEDAQLLHRNISEIMMAQGFQDLTGQMIRRVITLVTDVEQSLVDLIRVAGGMEGQAGGPAGSGESADIAAEGPQLPSRDDGKTVSGQDEVDDLLSSLGF